MAHRYNRHASGFDPIKKEMDLGRPLLKRSNYRTLVRPTVMSLMPKTIPESHNKVKGYLKKPEVYTSGFLPPVVIPTVSLLLARH